ncbi:ABC transporter ATP-binding protein [Candidatus Contubernalis alkaliaceticus]|uniref:ABC transporter ATP-binding protein n=1 Tax=Candidatus Contubernalis alkaliaceticus TaxID=338645 RepID=UPI001F4C4B2C|nr:ABC transporter ATP-binding protein [Candidatus Contubernalis alkalaceticus]UNC93100.1 ABC transporter ATP-binding protein [Candidatus Contubernalis alkalaceticus]
MQQREGEKQKKGLSRLLQIAGTKKILILISMFLSVLATMAHFVPYIAIYLLIQELLLHLQDISAVNTSYVWRLALISIGSIGLFGVILYTAFMFSHVAAFNILYEIRVALAEKLSKLPMGYFTGRASGEIKKVMSEDVERVELFVAHHIPDLTAAVIFPLLTLAYLFLMDWRLALASFFPIPLALALQSSMFFSKKTGEINRGYQTALEKMNASIVEYVRGMQVVKVFNQSVDVFQRLKNDIYSYRDFTNHFTKLYSYPYPGYLVLISTSLLFILPTALYILAVSPDYTSAVSVVFLLLVLGAGLYFPMLKLMWMGGLLNQISLGVDRIDDILFKPEIPEARNPQKPADNSVEFKNVHFSYVDTEVLREVSFRAEPGTVTALVGPSGAGKSTIAYLIPRFWDITQGEILLGGVNIKDISTEELMEQVSFVFQDGFLFFDSIEENIRVGNRSASKQEVMEAARAAQCHEFIQSLPMGYDTLVGEGGTYLSGGEQQRLALARAILKNSPVVVLDEATAYTDPENEGKMLTAFSRLIENKTVIVIAHRLSTITDADSILVVDQGCIGERGKHGELLEKNGLYKQMWEDYHSSQSWVMQTKEGVIS